MLSDSEDEIYWGPITLKEIKKEFSEFENHKVLIKTEMNTDPSIIEISSTENSFEDNNCDNCCEIIEVLDSPKSEQPDDVQDVQLDSSVSFIENAEFCMQECNANDDQSHNTTDKISTHLNNQFTETLISSPVSKVNNEFLNQCINLLDLNMLNETEVPKHPTNASASSSSPVAHPDAVDNTKQISSPNFDTLEKIRSFNEWSLNCSDIVLGQNKLLENSTQTSESCLLNSFTEYSLNKTESSAQTETETIERDHNKLRKSVQDDIIEQKWKEAIAFSDASLITEQTQIKNLSVFDKSSGNLIRSSDVLKNCASEFNNEQIRRQAIIEQPSQFENLSVELESEILKNSTKNFEVLKTVSKSLENSVNDEIFARNDGECSNSESQSLTTKTTSEVNSITEKSLIKKNPTILDKTLENSDELEISNSECNNTLEEIECLLALEEKYTETNNKFITEAAGAKSKNTITQISNNTFKSKPKNHQVPSRIPHVLNQSYSCKARQMSVQRSTNNNKMVENRPVLKTATNATNVEKRTNKSVRNEIISNKKKISSVSKQIFNKENVNKKLNILDKKLNDPRVKVVEENASCSPITTEVNKMISSFANQCSDPSIVSLKTTLHRQLSNLSIDKLTHKQTATPIKTPAKSASTQFKTPTVSKVLKPNKTPSVQGVGKLSKNIVSPVGMYINQTPQTPLIVKIRQPTRKKFFTESPKKSESSNTMEWSLGADMADKPLPFCAYKSATRVQLVENESSSLSIPKSIKKYFSPVSQCVIKHESRIKNPASPRHGRKLLNTDHSTAHLLDNSQAIFNASLDSSDVSFRIKKPALRPK